MARMSCESLSAFACASEKERHCFVPSSNHTYAGAVAVAFALLMLSRSAFAPLRRHSSGTQAGLLVHIAAYISQDKLCTTLSPEASG